MRVKCVRVVTIAWKARDNHAKRTDFQLLVNLHVPAAHQDTNVLSMAQLHLAMQESIQTAQQAVLVVL